MAKFIGTAGYFQSERAFNRRVNVLSGLMVGFGVFCFIIGAAAGFVQGRRSLWSCILALLAFVVCTIAVKFFDKRIDNHLRLARMDEHGASGEREILPYLQKLPDTYTVVCDLDFADSYGNIDHLVIGPTGIFSIDVKNWKGTVSADRTGELLLNGRPTDKPQVRTFTARTMDLKHRMKALTHLEPYIQCLFVFPQTYIEARWGSTGPVICLHADKLVDFITKPNPARAIPPADIRLLVKAARNLQDTIAPESRTPPPLPDQMK